MKRSYTNVGLPFGPRRTWSKSARSSSVSRPTLTKAVSKIMTLQRAVRAMRPEKKVIDTLINTDDLTGNVVGAVHLLAQGVAQNERVGNSIHCEGLYFNWIVDADGKDDTSNFIEVRFLIIQDLQQIGDTSPVATDMFEDPQSYPLTTPLKRENYGRFKILYERRIPHQYATPIQSTSQALSRAYRDSGYIKIGKDLRYNGANGTDIQKNGLYLVWLAADMRSTTLFPYVPGTVNNRLKIQSWARMSFTDA